MGLMLSCFAADAGIGLASKILSCLCCLLPWGRSTGSRYMTTAVYFFWSFIAFSVYTWMGPLPYPPITDIECGPQCYKFYAVYRIIVGLATGFFGLGIALIGVKSSENPRAIIQDGFWPIKFVVFAGLVAALFWAGPRWLLEAAFLPSCALSSLFLLAQSVLLVDFSYDVADWLLERAERVYEGFNWYKFALIMITLAATTFSVGSSVYLWSNFEGARFHVTILISVTLTVLMNIFSVLESVREANPNAGLLQSSILGAYVMFLVVGGVIRDPELHPSHEITDLVGFITATATILSVAYSAYSTGRSGHKLLISSTILPTSNENSLDESTTEYNYSLYQFVFVCASLYMGLMITGWQRAEIVDGAFTLVDVKLTFWVKVITSWVVSVLYIWSLFAPLILEDREFF